MDCSLRMFDGVRAITIDVGYCFVSARNIQQSGSSASDQLQLSLTPSLNTLSSSILSSSYLVLFSCLFVSGFFLPVRRRDGWPITRRGISVALPTTFASAPDPDHNCPRQQPLPSIQTTSPKTSKGGGLSKLAPVSCALDMG
jgi:hypothetical protein